jgi:hypothetical protein
VTLRLFKPFLQRIELSFTLGATVVFVNSTAVEVVGVEVVDVVGVVI